ncbi:type I methionyl aminopeptidase [Candidatus Nardonella dryophthoridicola]|nr:type I methionyl aminopeptidase [Candidatus Nardonella dryophthoridicola]
MMIKIYSNKEINKVKNSCLIVSETINMIKNYIKPNISTGYIDEICNNYIIKKKKSYPAPLNYKGFPKSICTSVNDTVCHGIPSYNEILNNGDIINIDISVLKNGFYGDASKTFIVGKESNYLSKKICYIAKKSLELSIKILKPGLKIKEIGNLIQKYVNNNGLYVVREYCGHGIGRKLHEEPFIQHCYNNNNEILKPGMIITIEPIINSKSRYIRVMKNGWTVKTIDKGLSAQYENTILITKNNYEILTNI